MMKIKINWQINIDNNECATLPKTKLRVFICVFFKKDIDCIMIEIPLSEISPVIRDIVVGVTMCANSLQPRVISTIPYKHPDICCFDKPKFDVIGWIRLVRVLKIFNIVRSSESK